MGESKEEMYLITAVVRHSLAEGALKAALEAGAPGITYFWARGTGVKENLGYAGTLIESEKQVVFVVTDPAHAAPDKTLLYRAMNVNGYEAFFLEAFPAWAAASEGKPAADASRSYLTRHDTPWMKKAGVAFKIDAGGRLLPAPSPWTLAAYADGEGGLSGRMQVALPRPERLLAIGVAPESASEIKVSVPFYPGWRARLGGRPVLLEQDGLFSKVRLPADAAPEATLELRLDFKPRRWALFAPMPGSRWSCSISRARGSGRVIR